jgi:outer membrane immunogenic protein
MRKLLLTAASLLVIAGQAPAADMGIKVPLIAPIPVFNWSSCYAGAQAGYGWGSKDFTDPVQLVQDQVNQVLGLGLPPTPGVTTITTRPSGYILGGQFGCDYQPVGSSWVVGFEGAVTGANIRSDTFVALPLGLAGELAQVTARLDFIPSGTVRVGYAWDRFMLYVKGGAAGASDKYTIVGAFQANPFNFGGVDLRYGWTAGAGVEWAFWDNWSIQLEYDYYNFGTRSVLLNDSDLAVSAPVNISQTVQTVRLGLNFRMWSGGWQ